MKKIITLRLFVLVVCVCCMHVEAVQFKHNIFDLCKNGMDIRGKDCEDDPFAHDLGRLFQSMTDPPSGTPAPAPPPTSTVRCNVDGNGSFGTTTAEPDRVVVDFAYQVETVAPRTDLSAVLPTLERSFNDELLPSLFERQCAPTNDAKRTRRMLRRIRRRLTLLGISPLPVDIPLSNVNCTNTEANQTSCQVVRGGVTIFHDNTTSSDAVKKRTRNALQSAMTAGTFDNDVHPAIQRVTYLDFSVINATTSSTEPQGSGENDTAGKDNKNIIWGVVGATLGLILILSAYVWTKRRRDQPEEYTEMKEEDDEIDIDELSPERTGSLS